MTLNRIHHPFPSLWREFDELFTGGAPEAERTAVPAAMVPATDVIERDAAIELRVDLPGVSPEAIEVKLDGNVLTLSAERSAESTDEQNGWVRKERSWGRFARSFVLPETVEGTEPQAAYKHGVLTVTLPKKAVAQPRTFKVKVEA